MEELAKVISNLEITNKALEKKNQYLTQEVIYLNGLVKTFQKLIGILTALFIIAAISAIL